MESPILCKSQQPIIKTPKIIIDDKENSKKLYLSLLKSQIFNLENNNNKKEDNIKKDENKNLLKNKRSNKIDLSNNSMTLKKNNFIETMQENISKEYVNDYKNNNLFPFNTNTNSNLITDKEYNIFKVKEIPTKHENGFNSFSRENSTPKLKRIFLSAEFSNENNKKIPNYYYTNYKSNKFNNDLSTQIKSNLEFSDTLTNSNLKLENVENGFDISNILWKKSEDNYIAKSYLNHSPNVDNTCKKNLNLNFILSTESDNIIINSRKNSQSALNTNKQLSFINNSDTEKNGNFKFHLNFDNHSSIISDLKTSSNFSLLSNLSNSNQIEINPNLRNINTSENKDVYNKMNNNNNNNNFNTDKFLKCNFAQNKNIKFPSLIFEDALNNRSFKLMSDSFNSLNEDNLFNDNCKNNSFNEIEMGKDSFDLDFKDIYNYDCSLQNKKSINTNNTNSYNFNDFIQRSKKIKREFLNEFENKEFNECFALKFQSTKKELYSLKDNIPYNLKEYSLAKNKKNLISSNIIHDINYKKK